MFNSRNPVKCVPEPPRSLLSPEGLNNAITSAGNEAQAQRSSSPPPAGLNSAITSAGNALEAQAQRSSSQGHKISHTAADLAALKGALFGAAAVPEQPGPVSAVDATSVSVECGPP